MDKVFQLAKELSQELKKNPTYVQYLDIKERVAADGPLLSKLNDYRSGRFKLEIHRANGEDIPLADEQAMGSLYAEIIMHPDGAEFLRLEKTLLDAIENIQTILYEDLSVDIEFLREA